MTTRRTQETTIPDPMETGRRTRVPGPGDLRGALERAYREFGADLWRAIYAYAGGDPWIADEAVAEAFAQAGRRGAAIRDLRPWIHRAAFRIAAGELGSRRRHLPLGAAADRIRQRGFGADDPQDQGFGVVDLVGLLRPLSPAQRAAFVLRVVFDLSSAEAAEAMGTSQVAVRVHLHAARRRLRDLLGEEVLES